MTNVLKSAATAALLLMAATAGHAADIDVEAGDNSKVVIETTEIHNHYGDDDGDEYGVPVSRPPQVRAYQQPLYANACQNPYGQGRYALDEGLQVGQPCMINLFPPVYGVGTIF